jgi:fatty-acyl-CoA synthase
VASKALTQGDQCLGSWLQARAERFGQRAALESVQHHARGEAISFAALDRRTAALAAGMYGLGLQPGDAIAIWLPNRPSWMLVHMAASRLGLLTVPLNTWYRDSELSHFVRLGQCRAIFIDSSFRGIDFDGILGAALRTIGSTGTRTLEWIVEVGPESVGGEGTSALRRMSLRALEGMGADKQLPDLAEDPRLIAYSTSGTTSAPKLAAHCERALLSHAAAVACKSQLTAHDVVLGALPPCGAYGYTLLLAAMTAGARAIVIDEFDLNRVVDVIEAEGVTVLALTEPIMRRLLDHPKASRDAFRSLRLVFSAGGTLESVVERAEGQFGFRVTNVYGSSEILALAAFWDFERGVAERSAAGGLLTSPGMQVRAVDSEGKVLPPRMNGELQFSGPIVTRGYVGNEEANDKAFTADGWFRSGDLGSVVDGSTGEFLYVARMNDALRIKGFLVSPGEIETMLQSHPGVAAAQVVGIPDGLGEEIAAAFVIARDGSSVSAEVLRDFCRERMASYKTPAILQVVDAFPVTRSANGDKVMKNKLREMAQGLRSV